MLPHQSSTCEPPPLFAAAATKPHPPHNASDTSRAAARSMRRRAPTLRERVHCELIRRGRAGATDEELQVALGMSIPTETARRNELLRAGIVRDSGRRRRTTSGRTATVWVISDAVR